MIEFELLRDKGILVVHPRDKLEASDFRRLAAEVDPWLDQNGALNGLMVEAASFPGWSDFEALLGHFRFVRDHHRRIRRVAAVSDSSFLRIMPRVAEHFAQPEIRVFNSSQRQAALSWLEEASHGTPRQ